MSKDCVSTRRLVRGAAIRKWRRLGVLLHGGTNRSPRHRSLARGADGASAPTEAWESLTL